MAYLGKYETRVADFKVYTSSTATATHTLSWTPTSKQSLRITINGVVQQDDAFSLTGNTVTLDAAILVTDVLEIVGVNELGGQVLVPADGSIQAGKLGSNAVTTAKIQDDAVTLAKMAGLARGKIIVGDASGDPAALTLGASTHVLTSDGSDAAWAATVSATNTPSFGAYLAANQGYSNDTWTKITMNTEEWDTDSAFDHTTNYRFTVPAGEGGKYSFTMSTIFDDTGGGAAIGTADIAFYKNGSVFKRLENKSQGGSRQEFWGVQLSAVLDLSAADYIEFYAFMNQNVASGITKGGQSYTFCNGFKLL